MSSSGVHSPSHPDHTSGLDSKLIVTDNREREGELIIQKYDHMGALAKQARPQQGLKASGRGRV